MKKFIDYCLYDSTTCPTYGDYVDECHELDEEVKPERSYEFEDWREHRLRTYWDDFYDNLRYCGQANLPCVVTGTVGLWTGSYQHKAVRYESIIDAIESCYLSRSSFEMEVRQEDQHLKVIIRHHDGTNTHYIHLLNKKGVNAGYDADLRKSCYHKGINGYIF